MNVGVTGARGFLGSDIVRALRAAGHDVVAFVREPHAAADAARERRYDLVDEPSPALLDGVDAIVHCAFVRAASAGDDAYGVNVRGTTLLYERARERCVPFVFISSLSAIPEARSVYGRQKLELERRLAGGASIVRPGLVVGNGGLVGALVSRMRASPISPLIDRGVQPVQCIWLADVSQIVRALLERNHSPRTWTVAVEPSLTVRTFTDDLRRALGLRAVGVSVPYPIAYGIASGLERAGVPAPLSVESLLGLKASRAQAVDDLQPLGVVLTTWPNQCAALAELFSVEKARR